MFKINNIVDKEQKGYIMYISDIHIIMKVINMDILISNLDSRPIYEQIYSQIKDMIIANTLKEGQALPSMRALAKDLRISVITTKRAYEELEKEGFVESFTGKGTFVVRKNMEFIKEENLKKIEENISEIVDLSKVNDISLEELMEILETIYEGD